MTTNAIELTPIEILWSRDDNFAERTGESSPSSFFIFFFFLPFFFFFFNDHEEQFPVALGGIPLCYNSVSQEVLCYVQSKLPLI